MRCILAYDVGGTFLRAGLVNPAGDILSLSSVLLPPLTMDSSAFSEKDPEDWSRHLISATAELLRSPAAIGAEISAVAISGLTRTQVFLDREGKSLRRALTWADGRATEQADRITGAQARLGVRGKTFGPINAYHTLARVLWIKENEPKIFDRISTILEPKDYLNFLLTGEKAGDSISLSRIMNVSDETLAFGLLEDLGLPSGIFPVILDPSARLGRVRSGLEDPLDRLAGIPVFVGAMDAWCGALGIGAVRAGLAFNASGTSEVFGVVMNTYRESEGLVTQPWGKGLFQIGGPSQAGADCLAWYYEAFEGKKSGLEYGQFIKGLREQKRQPEPVLFLPYLRGERTPLWEPDARGLLLGLNRLHTRVDFIWAILEGVAFANRQVLELAAKGENKDVKEVRITGGAVEADMWCQIKADILNLPLVRTKGKEAALLGAAMLAMIGLGEYTDIIECQQSLVRVERVFEPRRERAAFYDRLFRRWLEAQRDLLPVTRALTRDVREGFLSYPSS